MVPKGGKLYLLFEVGSGTQDWLAGGAWDRGIDGVYPLISRTSGNLHPWGGGALRNHTAKPMCRVEAKLRAGQFLLGVQKGDG